MKLSEYNSENHYSDCHQRELNFLDYTKSIAETAKEVIFDILYDINRILLLKRDLVRSLLSTANDQRVHLLSLYSIYVNAGSINGECTDIAEKFSVPYEEYEEFLYQSLFLDLFIILEESLNLIMNLYYAYFTSPETKENIYKDKSSELTLKIARQTVSKLGGSTSILNEVSAIHSIRNMVVHCNGNALSFSADKTRTIEYLMERIDPLFKLDKHSFVMAKKWQKNPQSWDKEALEIVNNYMHGLQRKGASGDTIKITEEFCDWTIDCIGCLTENMWKLFDNLKLSEG